MTSRVQKGGTLFKPVAKTRPRSTPSVSRQTSLTIDSPSIGTQNVFHAGELCEDSASSLMPPPTVIPISTHQVEFNNLLDRISAHDQDPSISQTHLAPVPSPILISTRKNTESVESRPTYILPREKSPQEVSQGGSSLHTEFLSTVSQESEPISVTRIVSNTEHIVKPQRKLTAKDTSAQVDNSPSRMQSEGEHGTLEQQSSPISREDRIFEGKRKLLTSDSPEEDEEETSTKTARTSPAISRSRRSKAPSLPPYDSAADPGEEIDPTVVTMATLCSDTGTGRVSSKAAEILSNHAAWKTKNREKRARMKTMMEAKKYGREETDGSEQTVDETPSAVDNAGQASTLKESAPIDNSGNGFDYSEDMATSRFNVQVRIGPNGETVIDEESLVVDRVQAEDINDYTHVVESDNTKFVNSGSYGKQYRGSRWSAEETELFYDALSQYGENYELIAYVLPGRDRKSCKNKFKVEDKRNHARINYCLNNSIPVDMKTLSRMTGKDFSGPVPDIRAPTPPSIPTEQTVEITPSSPVLRKRSRSGRLPSNDGVLIVGDVYEQS